MKTLSLIIGILLVPMFVNLGLTIAGQNGRYMTLMTGASSSISMTGVLYAIHQGSATELAVGQYAVVADSVVATANTVWAAFSPKTIAPAVPFLSTGSYNACVTPNPLPLTYRYQVGGEDGIRISTGVTVLKTTAESGEAYKTWLEWGYK